MNAPPKGDETPRTKAELETFYRDGKHYCVVRAGLAMELETELHTCRIALGIADDEKIPDQTPKHGSILVDRGSSRARISPTNDENIKLSHELTDAHAESTRLKAENERLRDIAKQLLFAAENADETGYVTDVGFIDLDVLHTEAHALLAATHEASGKEGS